MWETIKAPFVWVKNKWNAFEAWVASKAPEWKVKLVALAGGLVDLAVILQDTLKAIPAEQLFNPKYILIANAIAMVLIIWLRGISARTSARV